MQPWIILDEKDLVLAIEKCMMYINAILNYTGIGNFPSIVNKPQAKPKQYASIFT
jgi:hypothetical protein